MGLYQIVGETMLEQLFIFFKNVPRHVRHSQYRLFQQKKQLTLMVAIFLAIILLLKVLLTAMALPEITQATILYRLAGFLVFGVIFIAIWNNYKNFPRDYYVTRHFNSSPMLHILISSCIYSLVLLLLMTVIGIVKPVNADTLIVGVLFYTFMTFIFIALLSYLLGLIRIIYAKLDVIFYILVFIVFCLLPIIFIKGTIHGGLSHFLMLNPVYYLVNGFQQSVIVGSHALNHLGYHFYFICWIGLLTVLNFALNDYVSQLRPNEHIQTQVHAKTGLEHKDYQ